MVGPKYYFFALLLSALLDVSFAFSISFPVSRSTSLRRAPKNPAPLLQIESISNKRFQKIILNKSKSFDERIRENYSLDPVAGALASNESKKVASWLLFLVLARYLKSFYAVILGTFILSYIGNSAVDFCMEKGNRFLSKVTLPFQRLPRNFYAAFYNFFLLATLTIVTVLTVPRLNVEFQFLANLGEMENPYVTLAEWGRESLGIKFMNKLEPFLLSVTGETGRIFAGYNVVSRDLIASKLDSSAPWGSERVLKFAKLLQFCFGKYIRGVLSFTRQILTQLTAAVYKAVLSLLFSLMIVWDWPKLKKIGSSLERSRIGFAYKTVAPQLSKFGELVGQSFEVQFLIALCNTILTTLGLLALGIKGAWLLSFLVFICSFIPVAGVFISTLPMALAALGEYGVFKVFEVILMVLLVHGVEAYLLNPQIYGAKLKLRPVLVLAVLYLTEHVVGVQGLIIAIPAAVFVFNLLGIDYGYGSAEKNVTSS